MAKEYKEFKGGEGFCPSVEVQITKEDALHKENKVLINWSCMGASTLEDATEFYKAFVDDSLRIKTMKRITLKRLDELLSEAREKYGLGDDNEVYIDIYESLSIVSNGKEVVIDVNEGTVFVRKS